MKTILFQGDSVTDCGRRREEDGSLGGGYPSEVCDLMEAAQPGAFRFLNRGISGDRVRDLRRRWQADCMELQPDVVSILVGVNDTWRRYDRNDITRDEAFAEDYRAILTQCRAVGIKCLLMTPFLLDTKPEVTRMREDLSGKQAVVRALAQEFDAALLDADDLFAQEVREQNKAPAAFARDGVHPTAEGHSLLAKWVRAALQAC
ncbi:MAG: SGNH/GDSL hydrolase family protein [Oscillospiraceae bacterium]|jgi:lysophospholipase L1-like esterase|nr:SGNH/GDSL hydrolase family protein [Oscillospiraceae bacterium]